MKDKVLKEFNSCNKKEVFYWIHLVLFFLSNMNTNAENYVRVTILGMYVFGLFYVSVRNPQFKRPPNYLLGIFGIYLILNTVITRNLSVHIIYCIVTFVMIRELKFSKKELLSIINKTAIIYFIISVLLSYTPLKVLSIYDTRLVVNKFFPDLLFRFIGVEGTPAGPDIFYVLVLVSNIFLNRNKNKYFYITLSIIILVWASSFAPILSVFGALLILPFRKNNKIKITYSAMIWLYQFLIIYIYSFESSVVRHALNIASTLRSRIWYNMYSVLIQKTSFSEWFLGRKVLVGFENTVGYYINNPHNFSLFLLQFGGIITYIIIIVIATVYFKNMSDKYKIFIVAAILIYASTNTFILTIRGNPIFMYILITYLSAVKEPDSKLRCS